MLAAAKDVYERVGEATEVALRVLVEKIGLPGPAGRPSALEYLPKPRRASYCNMHWQDEYEKVRCQPVLCYFTHDHLSEPLSSYYPIS